MKKNTLVFLGFTALTIVMTYPLFFKINNHIAAFFSTDEISVWYFWWLKYANIHSIPSSFSHLVGAPFGSDLSVVERIYPVCILMRKLLVIPFNEFTAWNFEILLGFILSAFFVYLTTRYLVKKRTAAFFSGIVFAFCPYHFARAWQHIGLSETQWLALFIFSILRLKEKINKWNILFAFLTLYFAFSFDLYYAYFSLIIALIFIIYTLLKEQNKSFRLIFWIAVISLANLSFLAFGLMPFMKNIKIDITPGAWGFIRPLDDLFSQSAKPLSYILPATVHPIFGKFTESFIGTKWYGGSYTEHALYLGWTPLILAFVAFRRWRRKRREFKKLGTVPFGDSPCNREDFYIGFFVFLAFAAWLFSQPPWWNIFGFKLYMPSFFMYKILPMFRAYCRFGIVLMLAVAVLAGFGLKFVLERFKSQKAKLAITSLFCGLVLFEFWNWPPYKVIDLSKVPAVYYWLKEQPKDIVIADYPLDADSPNELYKFFQTVHEKKIINGTIPGTYANKVAQEIRRLSQPKTASILKWMGVKYVVVHKDDYLKTDLIEDKEDMERIPQNQGLKFVKSFPSQECPNPNLICVQKTGPIDVYEVAAEAIEPHASE